MEIRFDRLAILIVAVCGCALPVFGQGYGTDTQNVMTPAAGGMAGVFVARPQDVPAAVFGNPSTLSQFRGTQFTLGGGWVEGYPTVTYQQTPPNPLFPNFTATSRTQGFAGTEIGVTQDLRSRGLPGTLGIGVAGLSGLGAEYRGLAPANDTINNLSSEYMVLGVNVGAGFDLTDRLSAGASVTLGTGFEQLGFVNLPGGNNLGSTAMVHDYALRATLGVDYDLTPCDTLAFYYQTKLGFSFPNAVLVGGNYRDLDIDQPETFGFGYANRSLLDGDLLIAADVYYKLWEEAALWEDVFVNQWAFALGAQLTRGRNKFRAGLFVQHQSHQSQRGRPAGWISRAPVASATLPGSQHGADPAAPDHRRCRAPGRPGSGPRLGPVCRRHVQSRGRVWRLRHHIGRRVLRRHGPDLAVWGLRRARRTSREQTGTSVRFLVFLRILECGTLSPLWLEGDTTIATLRSDALRCLLNPMSCGVTGIYPKR